MKFPELSSTVERLKDGRLPVKLDRPLPLLRDGKKIGTVAKDGRVHLPDRQESWLHFQRAGDVEHKLMMYGARVVYADGKPVAAKVIEA